MHESMIVGYKERDMLLRNMGYKSYKSYLSSELWEEIKEKCREIYGDKCILCNSPSGAFHHLDYAQEVLFGEDLTKIVPICHRCHVKVEFSKKEIKRTMMQALNVFNCKLVHKLRKEGKLTKWCQICGEKAKAGFRYCKTCLKEMSRSNYTNKMNLHAKESYGRAEPRPIQEA